MEPLDTWMQLALDEARRSEQAGEVPVGAIVILDGEVIARAHNRTENDGDPSGHAEIVALRQAAKVVGDWRLDGTTLVATLEPCPMCAGAAILARVQRVVYGAPDPRYGACGSAIDLLTPELAPHVQRIDREVCGEECSELLLAFFRRLRKR